MTLTPGTTVDEAERRLILLTLDHTRNNKTRAAEMLGHQPEDAAQQAQSDEERGAQPGDRGAELIAAADRERRPARIGAALTSLSIKAKQVAGVTTLVVVIVLVMSTWHLVTRDAAAPAGERGRVASCCADAMFQRVFDVDQRRPPDPYAAHSAGRWAEGDHQRRAAARASAVR